MLAHLLQIIDDGNDILALGAGLLRLCSEHIDELRQSDADRSTWSGREALRQRCEDFFHEVDDEELYREERAELRDIAVAAASQLSQVVIAHTIAEALDAILGSRFLPMFLGRRVVLCPGDPLPVPHRDWRRLAAARDSHDGVTGQLPLHGLAHLRLAGPWADRVQVTVEGNWRDWHLIPQLESGDRLACAVPNNSLEELYIERADVDGRPVFYNAHFGADTDEQTRLCLALLDAARANHCRVVAFPELSVPSEAHPAIRAWLDSQDVVDVIAAGSAHRRAPTESSGESSDDGAHPAPGQWYGEATLYFRGSPTPRVHRTFCRLALPDAALATGVQSASVLESGLESGPRSDPGSGPDIRLTADPGMRTEHLVTGTPAFGVHISPHWLAVLLLGDDAVTEPVPRALCDLEAGLVLIPALSFDIDPFCTLARDLAGVSHGATLVANACVEAGPGSDVGEPTAADPPTIPSGRPEVVIGLPVRAHDVIAESAPSRSLVIATIGSLSHRPSIVTLDD